MNASVAPSPLSVTSTRPAVHPRTTAGASAASKAARFHSRSGFVLSNRATSLPSASSTSRQTSRRRLRVAASLASGKGQLEAVRTASSDRVVNFADTMRSYQLKDLSDSEIKELLQRPRIDFTSIFDAVRPIVEAVQERGDAAVLEYTERFDRSAPSPLVELVADMPDPELPADVKEAFDVAFDNIYKFHLAQKPQEDLEVETMPGVRCRRVLRPIGGVGLYVPGGTAVLPSTALMLSVPAKIAGCSTIVLATPPRTDGSINPEVLYVAKKAGVTHILKAGGAQAVAAMSYGTESCPKVDKILGPGNQYVTAAKMLLQNSEAMISIDMPAGPSEVLVMADEEANPVHIAADLLSQAEHGPDSQVVLVVTPGVNTDAISAEVERQCEALPRNDVARKALSHSYIVVAEDIDKACDFSNQYAPEHLIVNTANCNDLLPKLTDAGSIFLGRYTPESVGDYASGTNHVLPTYGYAKMYGGVSLDTFVKKITVQELSYEGLQNLGPSVAKMAAVEGLEAHRRAVTLRLDIP